MELKKQTILLTGGTGSFGRAFINYLLLQKIFKGIIRVFSRDEFKQYELQQKYPNEQRLRFFIGDVRDAARLKRAMSGVNIVIHAAALKQIPILEYNPFEAVKTNISGTQNVIDCAIDLEIEKAILISSDKACSPVNLYGATKMVAEKIFVQGNAYVGRGKTKLSVVRYGNVMASRGSVVPKFLQQTKSNVLTITDEEMTRFWITLDEGVKFVLASFTTTKMSGGEIFVPKLPSVKIVDLAKAIAPNAKFKIVGIRPGEKLHEMLISEDEARHTLDCGSYFVIKPEFSWWREKIKNGKRLKDGFNYTSENNSYWLTVSRIKALLRE